MNKDKIVTVRFTEKRLNELKANAARMDIKLSEYMRLVVRIGMELDESSDELDN